METHSLIDNNREMIRRGPPNEFPEYNSPIEMQLLDVPNNSYSTKASSLTALTRHSDMYSTDTEPIVDRAIGPKHSRYSPLALRLISLLGFVAIFTTLAVSLGILYNISERHQGLATADESWHYIFKYGPTAVLTVVAAFWGQVEYRAKQLAPWRQMSTGFASAKATLLLDYISPSNIVILPMAVKARQYPVVLAVSASLFIKALIIVSTGLFVLKDQIIEHTDAILLATDKYDAANFNSSSVDTRPYLNVYGIAHLNQNYPSGAQVDVISGDLNCEVGTGYGLQYIPHSTRAFLSASASGCSLEVQPNQLTWDGYLGYMTDTTCTNQTGEAAQRFLICTAHMRESPPEVLPDGSSVWHQYATDNTTCLICKPTYRRMPANVRISGNADIPSKVFLTKDSESTPIPSLSAWALGYAAFRSMAYTTAILNSSSMFTDKSGFFQLVNYTSPQPDMWNLLDPHWLQEGSRKAFQLLIAQVAKSNILVPANQTVTGTISTNEHRLCIQRVSFYIMESLFGLLTLLTLALCLLQHKVFVPRDVGSLVGLATIFAQSNNTISTLRATAHFSDKQLENHLAAYTYCTTDSSNDASERFQIFVSPVNNARENFPSSTSVGSAIVTWWRPMALTPLGRVMTFLIPLILIMTAQLLLQRSQNLDGIAHIAPIAYIQYAWTLLPALVMLGVTMLFDMFNAAARLLQPYLTLRKGKRLARCSPRAYSIVGVYCGPLLTIIVSGLYKPGYVAQNYPVEVYTTTWFNKTPDVTAGHHYYQADSANEDVLPSLILYGNMSLPRWTTSNFALGQIELSNTPDSQYALQHANGPVTLSTRLPAVKATLNCSTHPYQPINWTTETTAAEELVTEVQTLYINVTVPPECSSRQLDGSFDLRVWNGTWQIEIFYNGGISGAWVPFPNPGLPSCPTAAAIFGRPKEVPAKDGLTVLLCTPYMEALQVNATFSLPSFDLSTLPPPTADPTTSSIMSHDSAFLMLNSEATGGVFGNALVPVNLTNKDPRLGMLDAFFQALLEDSASTDPLSFLGPQNSNILIDAMETLYRMVMAQLFNSRKRITAVPGQHSILNATATVFDRQRLHQDPRSTHILEGLLAVMFLCALVAMLMVDTKHVLPKNPCSVAAVASLLAGSEFLELIPPGAERCGDSELRRSGVFEGYLFSLGWWGKAGSPDRRFGVDIGKAERAE